MWGALAHFFGLNDAAGPYYLAWSGAGSDLGELALIGGLIGLYHRHSCHVKGCRRLARQQLHGTTWVLCRKHHPDDAPTHEDVKQAASPAKV